MGRVIGLSLLASVLVLLAGLGPAKSDPAPKAAVPRGQPVVEWMPDLTEAPSPFAYVHEDGSLEYVPARGQK